MRWGIAHFNAVQVLHLLFLPVLMAILDVVFVPYFLARCIGWYISSCNSISSASAIANTTSTTYTTSALLVRYCHHIYVLLWLVCMAANYLRYKKKKLQAARERAVVPSYHEL